MTGAGYAASSRGRVAGMPEGEGAFRHPLTLLSGSLPYIPMGRTQLGRLLDRIQNVKVWLS